MSRKFSLKVKASSKKPGVTLLDSGWLEIRVQEPAREGKANAAVIKQASDYLSVSKSKLRIISGLKSDKKILEVLDQDRV